MDELFLPWDRPTTPGSTRAASGAPTSTAETLADYVGRYHSPELDTRYDIVLDEGRLIARHWKNDDITLAPSLRDEFSGSAWVLRNVEFVRGPDGKVTGFLVTSGRVRNLLFEKMSR